jgi:hypothetical protein
MGKRGPAQALAFRTIVRYFSGQCRPDRPFAAHDVGASKTDMHRCLSRISRFAGPADDARAEIFIDQQLHGAGPQARCRVSAFRGRPWGLGSLAWISA